MFENRAEFLRQQKANAGSKLREAQAEAYLHNDFLAFQNYLKERDGILGLALAKNKPDHTPIPERIIVNKSEQPPERLPTPPPTPEPKRVTTPPPAPTKKGFFSFW